MLASLKPKAVEVAGMLHELGYPIAATKGTFRLTFGIGEGAIERLALPDTLDHGGEAHGVAATHEEAQEVGDPGAGRSRETVVLTLRAAHAMPRRGAARARWAGRR